MKKENHSSHDNSEYTWKKKPLTKFPKDYVDLKINESNDQE